ncbi:MAG: ferredoxin family protein [Tannerella sp.]|nr:ferredoxin family protein [Tannerella sp.]
MKRSIDRLKRIHTAHVWINPRKCVACWKCVDACPKQVIGKVGFLWHKHIVIRNPENCSGCKACLKTCPHGVFGDRECVENFMNFINKLK